MYRNLNILEEKEFEFFRIPFKSGRQTLSNLKKGLYFGMFLQAFLSLVFYYVLTESSKPLGLYIYIIIISSFIISVLLIALSIIFAFPVVYQKRQALQYLVVSLVLFNVFGLSMYSIAIYLMYLEIDETSTTFSIFLFVSIIIYIVFATTVLFRIVRSLMKGDYRESSLKHNHEKALKADKKRLRFNEYLIALIGAVFVIQFVLNNILITEVRIILLILLMFLLSYIGIYMFAHSLITYYCKKRFASFNFDEDGNLYPLGSGDRVRNKEELA